LILIHKSERFGCVCHMAVIFKLM